MRKLHYKDIAKKQALARNFMIGGAIVPLYKGDGVTKELDLYNQICLCDLYRLEKSENDFERIKYTLPNKAIVDAMFSVRHKWTLNIAILCRDKKGKVYYVQQRSIVVEQQCNYKDLDRHFSQGVLEAWNSANEDYRLTVCYCYIPDYAHEADEFHFNAMVHTRDILSKLYTKWEYQNKKEIDWFCPNDLIDFNYWFFHQKDKNYQPNRKIKISDIKSLYTPESEEQDVSVYILQIPPRAYLLPKRFQPEDGKDLFIRLENQVDIERYFKFEKTGKLK